MSEPASDPTADPTAEPTAEPTADPTAEPTADPAADPAGGPMVEARGLVRTYRTGRVEVPALRGASLTVAPAEFVAVTGRSGSGKTTLLNLIGGLDAPDGGTVRVAGRDVGALPEDALLTLRRDVIGFVFQSHGLLPVLSAAENIEVPLRLTRTPPAERDERVRVLLGLVGLADHAEQRPHELSGGQRQRVAVARALANRPRLLLADEPTGQLDSETAAALMPLLRAIVASEGVTVIVATHDPALLGEADRVLRLADGAITEVSAGQSRTANASTSTSTSGSNR